MSSAEFQLCGRPTNNANQKEREPHGKSSGDTLSLIVEPNCGPPLRYEARNSTGYPLSLCGTIPRSLNVNAAMQIHNEITNIKKRTE